MGQLWDHPTMTIKADSKKRVVVPDAHPGDVFAYEDHGNGHFHLVRLNMPDPPKRKTRAQVRKSHGQLQAEVRHVVGRIARTDA